MPIGLPGAHRRSARILILLGALTLVFARMVGVAPPAAAAPAVITVNSTGDQPDAVLNGVCATSVGTCTLRAALREAQGDATANTINFAIPGAGPHTIQLGSSLPEVSDGAPTTINGYSQSGAAVNTHASVSNAQLEIQIRGLGPGAAPEGLVLRSAGNVVRGLAFFNLRIGVRITGARATRNLVVGNFIGTDAAGTFGLTGSNSGAPGVFISGGATANQIGRSGAAGVGSDPVADDLVLIGDVAASTVRHLDAAPGVA